MKKELLILGAYGALGKGITAASLKNNYDKIYLFDPHVSSDLFEDARIKNIVVKDLSSEENVVEAFKEVKPSKEKLFFLYNTIGGYSGGKPLWETEVTDWQKMIDINLKASFLIAKHFSLLVKNSAGGSICLTSAMSAINPGANKAAYSIAKSGVISLVKNLALEGREINLSANVVAPFIIDTPSNRQWMPDQNYDRWVKPEEIGEFVNSVFKNFYFISGNVFEISNRFNIKIKL